MTKDSAARMIEEETALALHISSYDDSQEQPSEKTHIADEILKSARQHRVQLRQDPLLVEHLANYNVIGSIHPELYPSVAGILTFLQRLSVDA